MSNQNGFSIFTLDSKDARVKQIITTAIQLLSQLADNHEAKQRAEVGDFEVVLSCFRQTGGLNYFLDVFNVEGNTCDIAAVKNSKKELLAVLNSIG
jgi:hypothetical protein